MYVCFLLSLPFVWLIVLVGLTRVSKTKTQNNKHTSLEVAQMFVLRGETGNPAQLMEHIAYNTPFSKQHFFGKTIMTIMIRSI